MVLPEKWSFKATRVSDFNGQKWVLENVSMSVLRLGIGDAGKMEPSTKIDSNSLPWVR